MTTFQRIPENSNSQPAPPAPGRNHEVAFVVDQQSYRILEHMKEIGGFASDTELIREALRLLRTLQDLARTGFSEVIVQHTETGQQKLLAVNLAQRQPKPAMPNTAAQ